MHEGKIESAKLQIDEAVRILQGAIETIQEAQRWSEGNGQPQDASQDKAAKGKEA